MKVFTTIIIPGVINIIFIFVHFCTLFLLDDPWRNSWFSQVFSHELFLLILIEISYLATCKFHRFPYWLIFFYWQVIRLSSCNSLLNIRLLCPWCSISCCSIISLRRHFIIKHAIYTVFEAPGLLITFKFLVAIIMITCGYFRW